MDLTQKQTVFVEKYLVCGNATQAALAAGYSPRCARQIATVTLSKDYVQAAVAARQEAARREANIDRQQVLNGLLEGIAVARAKAYPMAMISGWREIGRMLGFYQPTRSAVRISAAGKAVRREIESLADEELLALADGARDESPV